MNGSVIEPIKALREATDDLTSQDLDRLFDDELTTTINELWALENRLAAMRLAAIGEADRRQIAGQSGYPSTASWLADNSRISFGRARSDLSLAHSLDEMPETAAALRVGKIDIGRGRRLADARAAHPELFRRDETVLVDSARTLTPRQLRTALDYWRQAADAAAFKADHEAMHGRRRLHISKTFAGMYRLDGDLDPESGAIVAIAIASLAEPGARDGDGRTAAQLRCDALADICRNWLDHGDVPTHGARRPHLSVLVDYEKLIDAAGSGRSEMDDGTVITGETARRLACDAAVSRVITRGPSEILDIGRTTRTVPPAIRRAVELRDGACTWPGCDRPPRLCDVHHVMHWADGGPTSVANTRLYCRPHHILRHAEDDRDRPP